MNCRACRSDRLDPVFEMEPMPLAGAFAVTPELALALPKFPLTWLLCHDCGLVNVEPDIPDEVIYRTYSYAASTVPALVRHHAEFAKVLTERYGSANMNPAPWESNRVRFLEIGCNDGVLLNQLPERWLRFGIDPSDVAADASGAVSGDYVLWNAAWPGEVDRLRSGYFDVVTSSNSFAHFSDIAGALEGVARVLRPGGEFWVEVHDLESTLASGQWDTVYHEHKVEWSITSLMRAAGKFNLLLVGWSREPLHGGLIRARFERVPHATVNAAWRDVFDFAGLQAAYDNREAVRADAAYGAAARATVYLNQCQTGAAYVIDGSPLRAGKFVPGLGIPVLPPQHFDVDPPGRTLITAWNHADDIRRRHPDYDGWVTAW